VPPSARPKCTVDVDALIVDAKLALAIHGLRGESLVDLEQVDIGNL
jgi:hypothetical protein